MTGNAGSLFVLASGSTARVQILKNAGLAFEVDPAYVDETAIKDVCRTEGLSADKAAVRLAEAKALVVATRWPGALVVGADQLLVSGSTWFDKPESMAAARTTLQALCGGRHRLISAAVAVRDGIVLWRHVDTAELTMRPYSERFLDWYMSQTTAFDLQVVGACRLEGSGIQAFERIEGDFFTILGLPLLPLLDFLRDEGLLID